LCWRGGTAGRLRTVARITWLNVVLRSHSIAGAFLCSSHLIRLCSSYIPFVCVCSTCMWFFTIS
jgi:hypothetical protein